MTWRRSLDAAVSKPFSETLRDTELDRGVKFSDFKDGWMRKVMVMGMAYDNLPMAYVSAAITTENRPKKKKT